MRKSCLAALLAGAMLFSLLTGCQAPASSQSSPEVSAFQEEQDPSLPPRTGPDTSQTEAVQPAASQAAQPSSSDASAQETPPAEDPPAETPPEEDPPAEEPSPEEPPDPGGAEGEGQQPAPSEEEQPPAPQEPREDPEPVASPGSHTLYILMYHSVVEGDGAGCNDWMTTTDHLRADLQWLKDHGYTTLLPSELAGGGPLPEKAVLITFDDGYADNYRLAFPILQEFQAKAVISVIARRTVDGKPDFLTWDMCREMVDSGLVEIGSHTYDSHREDPRGIKRIQGESREEYEARIFTDIEESIRLIEENVGQKVQFFAYPHGQTEPWADDFLRERFAVTVTTRHGAANTSNGFYDLPRYNINPEQPASKYLPD